MRIGVTMSELGSKLTLAARRMKARFGPKFAIGCVGKAKLRCSRVCQTGNLFLRFPARFVLHRESYNDHVAPFVAALHVLMSID